MLLRMLLCVLSMALLSSEAALASTRKIALVVGNGHYRHAVELPNPVNDAKAMTAKLEELGFEVVSGYDEDFTAMQATVNGFARKAVGADVALLFYAGHGMQVRGENYLVPVDARFADETSLDFEAIPVNFILRQMSRDVRLRMVFLDACRDNPLAKVLARSMSPSRSVTVGDGLAEIKIEDAGDGTVIAFATSPGDVAYDGNDEHSPFTAALLKHIDAPDLPIQNVLTRVTREVYDTTRQRQRPWVNTSLIGDVYLNEREDRMASLSLGERSPGAQQPAPGIAIAPAGAPANAGDEGHSAVAWDQEKTLFEFAQKGGAAEDYRAYLSAYPKGHFADIARNMIARRTAADDVASNEATSNDAPGAVVASLEPQVAAAATSQARSPMPASPAAAAMPALPASEMSEAMLGWSREQRRIVQVRLELEGQDLGTPDGSFGPRSRTAIMTWQSQRQLPVSGYFDQTQYELLVSRTLQSYAMWEAQDRGRRDAEASAARARQARDARQAQARRSAPRQYRDNRPVLVERRSSGAGDAAGAAFIGGLMGGVIGGAIGR